MSYHPIGQFDLTMQGPMKLRSFRAVGPTTAREGRSSAPSLQLFRQQLLWWEDIRTRMRRLLLMMGEVISTNRHLTGADKATLKAERARLKGLLAKVGRPAGSWSKAQLAALSQARQQGGVPGTMGLIEKSRYTALISEAKRMRASWDRLASTLPTRTFSPAVSRGSVVTTLSPVRRRVPGGASEEEVVTEEGPPIVEAPPPVEEPLDPTVTAPHDPTQPAPQEPDYYADPYASAPPPMPSEPSATEPLLPEPVRRIPWWAWALGLAAVGGGVYLVVKD